jgi:hypothetical protein
VSTDAATASAHPSFGARLRRLFGILGVFILIGPPLGAMVFMLTIALVGLGHDADLAGLTWIGVFALFYGIPFGYLIGIWPAAAAGILIGLWQAFIGRSTVWLALAAGLLVGVGFQVATGQPVLPSGDDTTTAREQGPIMIATCVAATLVCWLIVRTWHFGPAEDAP